MENQLTKKDAEHQATRKKLRMEEDQLTLEKSKFLNEKEITLAKIETEKSTLRVRS